VRLTIRIGAGADASGWFPSGLFRTRGHSERGTHQVSRITLKPSASPDVNDGMSPERAFPWHPDSRIGAEGGVVRRHPTLRPGVRVHVRPPRHDHVGDDGRGPLGTLRVGQVARVGPAVTRVQAEVGAHHPG